jgi:hypothetical protein
MDRCRRSPSSSQVAYFSKIWRVKRLMYIFTKSGGSCVRPSIAGESICYICMCARQVHKGGAKGSPCQTAARLRSHFHSCLCFPPTVRAGDPSSGVPAPGWAWRSRLQVSLCCRRRRRAAAICSASRNEMPPTGSSFSSPMKAGAKIKAMPTIATFVGIPTSLRPMCTSK